MGLAFATVLTGMRTGPSWASGRLVFGAQVQAGRTGPSSRQGGTVRVWRNTSLTAASNRHCEWVTGQAGVPRPQYARRPQVPDDPDPDDRLRREEPWSLGDRPSRIPTSPATSAPSAVTTSGRSCARRSPTSACCAARSLPFVALSTPCVSSPRRCVRPRRPDPQRRRSYQRTVRPADLGHASSGPLSSTGGPLSLRGHPSLRRSGTGGNVARPELAGLPVLAHAGG